MLVIDNAWYPNCNGQSLSAPVACPLDELERISLQFPLHSVKEPEICLNQQKSADKWHFYCVILNSLKKKSIKFAHYKNK